jgi:hypothetical protein
MDGRRCWLGLPHPDAPIVSGRTTLQAMLYWLSITAFQLQWLMFPGKPIGAIQIDQVPMRLHFTNIVTNNYFVSAAHR